MTETPQQPQQQPGPEQTPKKPVVHHLVADNLEIDISQLLEDLAKQQQKPKE